MRIKHPAPLAAVVLVLAACSPAATPSPSAEPSGAPPSPGASVPSAGPSASATTSGYFPRGLLIADRKNGRVLVVDDAGRILWHFPEVPGKLPNGQGFNADDAFIDPSGRTIVANDEFHHVIDRIDIRTRQVVWQYGRYAKPGAGDGQLHTPDDAYPLANGDIVVADIYNCRILEIKPDKSIARQWGKTGVCKHEAGVTFAQPNGDTPLADGGLLVTEIIGSRIVRLDATGRVVFDIHAPVRYPSDAQLDADGDVVVADFSDPGQIVALDPRGNVLWTYGPKTGPGRLSFPSLATPLANGLVSVNDDDRQRVVVIDPKAGTIVWQFGRTDHHSLANDELYVPDGHEPLPAGLFPADAMDPQPSPPATPSGSPTPSG